MDVSVVRQAGDAREERRIRAGDAFDGDGVEVLHVFERICGGGRFAHALPRSAHPLEDHHAAVAATGARQHLRDQARRRRVVAERDDPGAGTHDRAERRGPPSVQGDGL